MKKPTILIIEDEEEIVYLTAQRAEFYGFECVVDKTGEACVKLARAYRPDVILLDLNLPSKPGIELIRDIRNDSEVLDIPIIVLTALCGEELIRDVLKEGASAYFSKTDDLDDLFDLIHSYLNNSEQLPSP